MRIYLDAAPVIYVVERVGLLGPAVVARLAAPDAFPIASDMTRLECRVKPIKDGDATLLEEFDEFFGSVSDVVPLTRAVLDRATEIRAQYGFKTPDAIHLAAAAVSRCDSFLTNDHRLDRFQEFLVDVVQP